MVSMSVFYLLVVRLYNKQKIFLPFHNNFKVNIVFYINFLQHTLTWNLSDNREHTAGVHLYE